MSIYLTLDCSKLNLSEVVLGEKLCSTLLKKENLVQKADYIPKKINTE